MSTWKMLLAPAIPLALLGAYGARAGANRLAGIFLVLAFLLAGTAGALFMLGGCSSTSTNPGCPANCANPTCPAGCIAQPYDNFGSTSWWECVPTDGTSLDSCPVCAGCQ